MVIQKNKYYFYIEDIRNINLNLIKKKDKFNFIYRSSKKTQKLTDLFRFKKECKKRSIKLFIANDIDLALKLNADGIYLSSHNNNIIKCISGKNRNFHIIGSAHNFREINLKIKQGCKIIIFSRLFKTDYKNKKSYYGSIKFNLICQKYKNYLIPLGGIRLKNLNNTKIVKSEGIALLSEIKKKPAIIRRLF